jgi:hypothetical protein
MDLLLVEVLCRHPLRLPPLLRFIALPVVTMKAAALGA